MNSHGDVPPVIYAPDARDEDDHRHVRPARNAAAIVVNDAGCKNAAAILIVRRSLSLPEYPGAWSFPSIYERDDMDLLEWLEAMLREELSIEVDAPRLIARRMASRPEWRILLHLYAARRLTGPILRGRKYDSVKWVDPRRYVAEHDRSSAGDCVKAYADHLAKDGPRGAPA